MRLLFSYLKNEEGQTSTEYILLVAVVALIVFRFKDIALEKLESLTTSVFESSNEKILNELNQ